MNTLNELEAAIDQLKGSDRKKIKEILDRFKLEDNRRRHILKLVQEALGNLQLDTKYLMFDLDCTKRERDEARQRS